VIALLVIPVALVLIVVFGRRRSTSQQADALLVSREDRTASFARSPGRLRSRGGL
jgi:hypothetical protein